MSSFGKTSSCNYVQDRSKSFKHNVPEGLIPNGAPSVNEYISSVRSKQEVQMRDWHLQTQAARCDSGKAEFSKSRNCVNPSSELNNPKVFLTLSVGLVALALGGIAMCVHF